MEYKNVFVFILKESSDRMNNTWRETPVKEKFEIINGTVLVAAAIVLYFVAFIVSLTIDLQVISASATLLATALAFFGITSFVKNQLLDFEATVNKRMKKIENEEQKRKGTDNSDSDTNAEPAL